MTKLLVLLQPIWALLVLITAIGVEIAWLIFVFGSVIGVVLLLIFYRQGFLLPFNFILVTGTVIGEAMLDVTEKRLDIEEQQRDLEKQNIMIKLQHEKEVADKRKSKEEKDRESFNQRANGGGIYITSQNKTEDYNSSDGLFNLLIGLIGAFIFIVIIYGSGKNESTDVSQNPIESNTDIHQANTESTIDAVVSESKNITETKDVEYYNKSNALWNSKKSEYNNPKKAIEYLTKAIGINPKDANYFNSRGVAYIQVKKYNEAIEDFNSGLWLNPKEGNLFQGRGYAYWYQENKIQAKDDANTACKLGECQLKKDLEIQERNSQSGDTEGT